MNARAVSHIEHGMNQDAVHVLEQAMKYLGTRLNQQRYEDLTASIHYDCAQQGHANRNRNDSIGACRDASASRTTSTSSSIGGASRSSSYSWIHEHAVSLPRLRHRQDVYDSAFHLPFSDDTIMSLEYRTPAIAVLFYNTATAFHRYGIQSGKSELLGHAAVSYNAILTMVGPHTLQLFPEIVVIILGLMSNLAHIHLELRQVPEFLSARAILRELMSQTPYDQMSQQDFAFFNLNLFCLDREDVSYAPAA
jgi:hypothetical protein